MDSKNGNISKAARDHNLTKDTLYYYWNDFRHGKVRQSHGGKRRTPTFTKEQYQLLVTIVVEVVKEKPNLGMKLLNFLILKKKHFFKLNKYSDENLLKLLYFYIFIYNTDWNKIYFMDECSFSSRDLRRTRGVGQKGKPVYCTNKASISETYNGFFTIGLDGCKYKMRDQTNSTKDFITYLQELLATGFIKKDSYLVMDNSPIHGGSESFQLIEELLGQYSVKLVFLPAYSPECNPIERLFGYIKNHFYNRRDYQKQFLDEIIQTIMMIKIN
ncbi:hypothetical protein ACTFIY_008857 [Dictyostelium cf. discoideum]